VTPHPTPGSLEPALHGLESGLDARPTAPLVPLQRGLRACEAASSAASPGPRSAPEARGRSRARDAHAVGGGLAQRGR
jgi:hypothetical protein